MPETFASPLIKKQLAGLQSIEARLLSLEQWAHRSQSGDTNFSSLDVVGNDLGNFQAGEITVGSGTVENGDLTGVAILYPPVTVGGVDWNFVGMNAGVLEVGISAVDGKLYAGGGVVILDNTGIRILTTTTINNNYAYQFYDNTFSNVVIGGLYGLTSQAGGNEIDLIVNGAGATGFGKISIQAQSGGTAGATSTAVIGSYHGVNIPARAFIQFNSPGNAAGGTIAITAQGGVQVNAGDFVDTIQTANFTATIDGTTTVGVGTYSQQTSTYCVIGKLVFVQIILVWTAHTGTGNMVISGLPYACTSNSGSTFAVSWSNITLPAVGSKLIARVAAGATQVILETVDSGARAALALDTAATLQVAGCYIRA